MTIELGSLSYNELRALTERANQLMSAQESSAKSELRDEIKRLVEKSGFSLQEILSPLIGKTSPPSTPKGSKLPAKYAKDGKAWTGRGRKPAWVIEHLNSGGLLEALLVKK